MYLKFWFTLPLIKIHQKEIVARALKHPVQDPMTNKNISHLTKVINTKCKVIKNLEPETKFKF